MMRERKYCIFSSDIPSMAEDSASLTFTSPAARSVGVVVALTTVPFVMLVVGGTVMLYGSGIKGMTSLAWLLDSRVGALMAPEARMAKIVLLICMLSTCIGNSGSIKRLTSFVRDEKY